MFLLKKQAAHEDLTPHGAAHKILIKPIPEAIFTPMSIFVREHRPGGLTGTTDLEALDKIDPREITRVIEVLEYPFFDETQLNLFFRTPKPEFIRTLKTLERHGEIAHITSGAELAMILAPKNFNRANFSAMVHKGIQRVLLKLPLEEVDGSEIFFVPEPGLYPEAYILRLALAKLRCFMEFSRGDTRAIDEILASTRTGNEGGQNKNVLNKQTILELLSFENSVKYNPGDKDLVLFLNLLLSYLDPKNTRSSAKSLHLKAETIRSLRQAAVLLLRYKEHFLERIAIHKADAKALFALLVKDGAYYTLDKLKEKAKEYAANIERPEHYVDQLLDNILKERSVVGSSGVRSYMFVRLENIADPQEQPLYLAAIHTGDLFRKALLEFSKRKEDYIKELTEFVRERIEQTLDDRYELTSEDIQNKLREFVQRDLPILNLWLQNIDREFVGINFDSPEVLKRVKWRSNLLYALIVHCSTKDSTLLEYFGNVTGGSSVLGDHEQTYIKLNELIGVNAKRLTELANKRVELAKKVEIILFKIKNSIISFFSDKHTKALEEQRRQRAKPTAVGAGAYRVSAERSDSPAQLVDKLKRWVKTSSSFPDGLHTENADFSKAGLNNLLVNLTNKWNLSLHETASPKDFVDRTINGKINSGKIDSIVQQQLASGRTQNLGSTIGTLVDDCMHVFEKKFLQSTKQDAKYMQLRSYCYVYILQQLLTKISR